MDSLSDLKYPIYIVSKGRSDRALTANFLKKENIPFFIAVEPQEYESYCKSIDSKYVLKLPFSNLKLGSYPARNFCWDHSIENKFEKHFIFDDNIRGFYSFNNGARKHCSALSALIAIQNFSDKFQNLAIAGFNYSYFVTKLVRKAFYLNTHVYSGMLINNQIPWRWRLKYNEDVDLCLQILNSHYWCTLNLNAFLIKKVSTSQKMPGGNQEELYKNNNPKNKLLKATSLQLLWPQYVKVTKKFNRFHHDIQWNKFFTHPLIKKTNSTHLDTHSMHLRVPEDASHPQP